MFCFVICFCFTLAVAVVAQHPICDHQSHPQKHPTATSTTKANIKSSTIRTLLSSDPAVPAVPALDGDDGHDMQESHRQKELSPQITQQIFHAQASKRDLTGHTRRFTARVAR